MVYIPSKRWVICSGNCQATLTEYYVCVFMLQYSQNNSQRLKEKKIHRGRIRQVYIEYSDTCVMLHCNPFIVQPPYYIVFIAGCRMSENCIRMTDNCIHITDIRMTDNCIHITDNCRHVTLQPVPARSAIVIVIVVVICSGAVTVMFTSLRVPTQKRYNHHLYPCLHLHLPVLHDYLM